MGYSYKMYQGGMYITIYLVLPILILELCYSEPVTRVRCGITSEDMVVVAYENYNMTTVHQWGRKKKPMWC